MELAEHVVSAKRLLKLAQAALRVGRAQVEELAALLGDPGERRPRLALGLVRVGDAEQPAEVGVAAQVARDQDQLLTVDLGALPMIGLTPSLRQAWRWRTAP